jgi:hypothetical protein
MLPSSFSLITVPKYDLFAAVSVSAFEGYPVANVK